MKAGMKKVLKAGIWTLFTLSIFAMSGFINHHYQTDKCQEVIIEIRDARSFGFVDEGDITDILNGEFHTPISQKIQDIHTDAIEKRLKGHQAIEDVEVYLSIDKKLHIELSQRKPVIRVFSETGTFYLDDNGKVMPTSNKFTAHVPVVTGEIDLNYTELFKMTNFQSEDLDSSQLPGLFLDLVKLSTFIENNPFWKAQIEHLYVDKESEFEMIPRVGNHTIVIGDVYDLESKFNKLKLFYEKGLTKTGWNEYKTINLKFKDQVVCTKRY